MSVGDAGVVFVWSIDTGAAPHLSSSPPVQRAVAKAAAAAAPLPRQWLPPAPSSTIEATRQAMSSPSIPTEMPLPVELGATRYSPRSAALWGGGRPESAPLIHDPISVHSGSPTQSRSFQAASSSVLNPPLPSAGPQVNKLGPQPSSLCSTVVGFTPSGAQSVVWRPEAGLFSYSVNNSMVIEDLATRKQRCEQGSKGNPRRRVGGWRVYVCHQRVLSLFFKRV